MEPVVPGHLFLGHVCSSHGADCGPCTSSQSVGGLAHGGSINDLGLHAIDPVAGVTPQEFLVVVAAELLGERAGISAKVFEGLNDAFGHERLHAVEPNVLGDTVDEKDSVALTQLAYGVAKNYVQVELVKVMVGGSKGFAAVPLAEVGKLADRRAGFIPLDKLSIFRGTAEVFVVVEMAVSKQMLYLVGGEILEGVRPVWCVTWTHVGRRCGWVGGKKDNSVLDNPSGLRRGLGRRGCCGSCVGNDDFKFNGIGILPIFCSLSNCGEGRGWRHRWGGGGRWRVQAGGAMGDGSSCGTLRGGPGLDVVEHLGRLAANGEVAHVGFDRVVHSHVKRREEVEDAVFVAVVSTAWDAAVEVEAEEGKAKVRDVLDVVDDHLLASHFNGDGSFVENVNLAVVSERDVLVVDVVL